jgi:hypothetical protein
MGWVVKEWRIEALAGLVSAASARELADAVRYLEALEEFGLQTREQVIAQRRRLRPARVVVPEPPAALAVTRDPRRTARHSRATLRDSPLTELFAAAGRRP